MEEITEDDKRLDDIKKIHHVFPSNNQVGPDT
jgi:hypothetical protein